MSIKSAIGEESFKEPAKKAAPKAEKPKKVETKTEAPKKLEAKAETPKKAVAKSAPKAKEKKTVKKESTEVKE
jgi:hypothetical protein